MIVGVTNPDEPTSVRAHGIRRLVGRDAHEPHRAATPLELLFDLTFVVAFGTAANELAHYLVEREFVTAVAGFCLSTFAVSWAWINYSWWASSYDEDDWVCRLATMVQMAGVVILALGLHDMFASIEDGETLDNGVMVAGYVVMRVPMVFQWLRAARHNPERRDACMTYVKTITVSQVGWCALIVLDFSVPVTFAIAACLAVIEMAGPVIVERAQGGLPWHPHHIAERYGLLVIITLGEGIIGTVASINAVVQHQGWNDDAVLLTLAGIGLTFGLWWTYFAIPSAGVLERHRERSFGWGYGHMFIFGSLAAVGAGLHAAAYYIEDHTHLGAVGTVLTVTVPVAVYFAALYVIYSALVREVDTFHYSLVAGTAAVLVLSVVLAAAGVSMTWCLVVVALAPVVTIAGYETLGHRHAQDALDRQ
jgi:low temperature requirement protein LtrA